MRYHTPSPPVAALATSPTSTTGAATTHTADLGPERVRLVWNELPPVLPQRVGVGEHRCSRPLAPATGRRRGAPVPANHRARPRRGETRNGPVGRKWSPLVLSHPRRRGRQEPRHRPGGGQRPVGLAAGQHRPCSAGFVAGADEPNSEGRAIGDWVQRTRWAMQALWEETRKRPAFDDVLVQGPPLNMKGVTFRSGSTVATRTSTPGTTTRGG